MNKFYLLLAFMGFHTLTFSQFTGKVSDAATGIPLAGAHIVLYDGDSRFPLYQSISGRDGAFAIPGKYQKPVELSVSYVGYHVFRMAYPEVSGEINLQVLLVPGAVPVGEVTVSTSRRSNTLRDLALPMAVVTSGQIDKIAGATPSDMLRFEPGLYVARDGIWATSLNIRGLSEQRIITLIDGNRVETATDLAASMAMIAPEDIERIEVIKGASSSLYGTGAMGGVVNIITKEGSFRNRFYANGSLSTGYQSVNSMPSQFATAGAGNENWYLKVSGSYRDAGNTMTPEGELPNSSFSDNSYGVKAGVRISSQQEIKINAQRYQALDAGMPGGKAFPASATATYNQVLRNLLSLDYSWKPASGALKEVDVKFFHQYIGREVELVPNALTRITPNGYHTTNGVQIQTSFIPAGKHAFIGGIDFWQRSLSTNRQKFITQYTISGVDTLATNYVVRGEVPIPESRYRTAGIFLQDEFNLVDDKLKVTMGGRFDGVFVKNDQAVDPLYTMLNGVRNENPPNRRITFEAGNVSDISWSTNLDLLFRPGKHIDFTLSTARAFRSPGLEERFKYIDLLSTVRIGDPNLKPESGWFTDFGIRLWYDKLQVNQNFFINSMNNLIIEVPGLFIYNYTANPGNYDTIPALINDNVDKALLYGFDFSGNYNVFDGISVTAAFSFIRGLDTGKDVNLPLMPPINGSLGISYEHSGYFGISTVCTLSAAQKMIASGETATPGYALYDLRIYSKPIDIGFAKLSLFTGVENLGNRAWLNHLSTNRGIIKYEPGRNFFVKLKMDF